MYYSAKIRSLSVLLIGILLASCSKKNSTKALRKDITQAVYASGKIFPLNDYKVFSKLPGYVEDILVNVGDSVQAGQALLAIRSEVSELNADAAKNNYELTVRNASETSPLLQALAQEVASARSRFMLDSANFSRFSGLLKENAVSRAAFDQAKLQYDVSAQNRQKAIANFNASRDRLNTEMENARLQYQAQLANRNDFIIYSAVKGKVYDIVPRKGDLVNSQLKLMEIGDAGHYEAELSIDEMDIALVKPGQEIYFSVDAHKDQPVKGKVKELYPRIDAGNKTSRVMATVDIPVSLMVYSGMSAEANIIIAQKKNALVLPREFFIDRNKLKVEGRDSVVSITKGIEDLQYVEVLDGIDENTVILRP